MTAEDFLHKAKTNSNVTYVSEYCTEDFISVSGWLSNKYFRIYFRPGRYEISSATEELKTFKKTFFQTFA